MVIVLLYRTAHLFPDTDAGRGCRTGLTVYVYIAQFPLIKVYGDKLTSKIALSVKVVAMPFDGGHFLQEVKGWKALMVSIFPRTLIF